MRGAPASRMRERRWFLNNLFAESLQFRGGEAVFHVAVFVRGKAFAEGVFGG